MNATQALYVIGGLCILAFVVWAVMGYLSALKRDREWFEKRLHDIQENHKEHKQ